MPLKTASPDSKSKACTWRSMPANAGSAETSLGSGLAWSRKVMIRWCAQHAATRALAGCRMYVARM